MQNRNSFGRLGQSSSLRFTRAAIVVALVLPLLSGAAGILNASEMLRPEFQGAAPVQSLPGGALITLGFNINLVFNDLPTPAEAAAFSAAEATWESLVLGYQINDIFSTTLTIQVNLDPIDGPGGILGSAGPTHAKLNAAQTAVTSTFLYSDRGVMTFDTADTNNMSLAGTLDDVILHEMGHVLGIGIMWSSSSVGFPGRQEIYVNGTGQYTGVAGLAAYNSEFNQSGTFVPVELGGGAGTANSHWNEGDGGGATGIVSNIEPGPYNDLRYELMTGWLNPPQAFISSLTIQSLTDIGYVMVPEPASWLLTVLPLGLLIGRRR